jgi:GT2 family glycosyltransferase
MKVGIVVTTHYSDEYRPNGNELIKNFCESAKHLSHPFKLYVFDNASVKKLDELNYSYVEMIRVENQHLRGLSGTWNDGIKMAIKDSCDIVIVSNDDVELNKTVNTFVNQISTHQHNEIGMYGPLSNGILGGIQKQNQPVERTWELTNNKSNMINGFFYGFTKDFYNRFKMKDRNLIDEKNYPWGGNEEELQNRIWSQGARSFVLGSCHIFHHKIRGWRQL